MSQKSPGPEIIFNRTTRYLKDSKCIYRTSEQQLTADLFELINYLFAKAVQMWAKYPAIPWRQKRYLRNCVHEFNQHSCPSVPLQVSDQLLLSISKLALEKRLTEKTARITDQEIQRLVVLHGQSLR